MNGLGPFALLIIALVVGGLVLLLAAIPVLLVRNFISRRPVWTGVGAWLYYPLIATVMIAGLVGSYLYATSKGIEEYKTVKWANILITAVFAFGYAVKKFWLFRKKWTFWAELGVLVVGHFALLSRLHWEQASYFWLVVVVGIPELAFVSFLLSLMFDPHGNLTKEDSQ